MLSNKSNSLSYMITDGSENRKNKFLMYFDPVTRVSDKPLRQFFVSIYLYPLFSRTVWINKLRDLMKRFSLTKVAIEIGKIHFFSYHSNDC